MSPQRSTEACEACFPEYFMAEAPDEGYPVSSILDALTSNALTLPDGPFFDTTQPTSSRLTMAEEATRAHLDSQGDVRGAFLVKPKKRRQLLDLPNEILTMIARHMVRNANIDNRNGQWRQEGSAVNARFINPLSYRLINSLFSRLILTAFMEEAVFHLDYLDRWPDHVPRLKYLTWCRIRLDINASDVQRWFIRRPNAWLAFDYAFLYDWDQQIRTRRFRESQRLVYEPVGRIALALHRLPQGFVPEWLLEQVKIVGISSDRLEREAKRAFALQRQKKPSTAASHTSPTNVHAAANIHTQIFRESPLSKLPRLTKIVLELPPFDWPPMKLIALEIRSMRAFLEMMPNVNEIIIARGWHVFVERRNAVATLAHYRTSRHHNLADLDRRFKTAIGTLIKTIKDEKAVERAAEQLQQLEINESSRKEMEEKTAREQ